MPRNVQTTKPLEQLPKGPGTDTQRVEASGTTVLLTDDEYNRIPASSFSSGALVDLGAVAPPGVAVAAQATYVAPAAALTAPADLGAAYSQANVNALRTDVAALQAKLNATLVALQGAGKPMAAS